MRRYAVAIALTFSVVACDPAVHASGSVRSAGGTPIAGAVVSLTANEESRVESVSTDSAGRFNLTRFGSRRPPFELRVCRDGYQAAVRTVGSLDALTRPLDFVLAPSAPMGSGSPRSGCTTLSPPAA